MIRRTVFITNRSVHDYSAAKPFGKFIYLSKGNLDPYGTSTMYRKFFPILNRSEPEDYILVSGLTVANMIAAFIFGMKHGRINLLLFKNKDGEKSYVERILIGGK